jgi:phosphate transport system protein
MSRMHFLMELESIRHNLIQTGEMTMSFFDEALRAVWKTNPYQPEKAGELKARIGRRCRLIHEQCLNVIILQAPVARDARFVTRVLDTVVDLDVIGDYFYEIVMLAASKPSTAPSQTLREISEIGANVSQVLAAVIDAWRKDDRSEALPTRPDEFTLRAECAALYEKLSRLTAAPGAAAEHVELMFISKYLELILLQALRIADRGASPAPLQQAQGLLTTQAKRNRGMSAAMENHL